MFAGPSFVSTALLGKEQPSPYNAMTKLCCYWLTLSVKLIFRRKDEWCGSGVVLCGVGPVNAV